MKESTLAQWIGWLLELCAYLLVGWGLYLYWSYQ